MTVDQGTLAVLYAGTGNAAFVEASRSHHVTLLHSGCSTMSIFALILLVIARRAIQY